MFRPLKLGLAGALAAAAWAVLVEPRRLVLRRRTIEVEGWPEPMTIACVSDLHAGAPQVQDRRVRRVVERVAALEADLVAVLGDLVDPLHRLAQRVPPHVVALRLSKLEAPLGVLVVLGNHDWTGEGEWTLRALRAARMTVLEDEALRLGNGVWAVGLADPRTRDPDVADALAAVPEDAPLLVLSHDPDLFPHLPQRPLLALSGHTHGGQVNLPWLRAHATPSRYGFRYGRGVVTEGRRTLFVTSGVGTSGWPVRFLRPPEIVLLTVTARGRTGSP